MPSATIPARLQFACGCTTLTWLPRIKGETSRQQTARVDREKAAARLRSCDFCAQRAAPTPSQQATPAPVAVTVTPAPGPDRVGHPAPVEPRQVAVKRRRRQALPTPRVPPAVTENGRLPRRFRVRYLAEAVIEADSLVDAVRLAEARGAVDVTAVRSER
jgi:hypothetical protein